jgi:Cof subfamily protein (haloacid dehalogenase superfamily)
MEKIMNNKIKTIVTDLDKTLLDNNGNISEYSKNILLRCMKNNIHIVFATARPIRATRIFYSMVKPNALICHNGAEILVDDKIIYNCGIKHETVNALIDTSDKLFSEYNLAVEINDKIYTNFDPSIYWGEMEYEDIKNRPVEEADKVIIGINDEEKMMEIKKHLSDELYFERSIGAIGGSLGLIINREATKWNGVKKLLEYYKTGIENTIAFGDNENDYEMVKNCGIGIAVENGIEKIKDIAKCICENNNEDGVAKWIEKNILE